MVLDTLRVSALVVDLLSILARRFLLLTSRLEFSHLVAALVVWWWKSRQPKTKNKKTNTFQSTTSRGSGTQKPTGSRHHRVVHQPKNRAPTASSSTTTTRSDENSSSSSSILLDDDKWKVTAPLVSTVAERGRFLRYNRGKLRPAVKSMQNYLEWREVHRRIEQEILESNNPQQLVVVTTTTRTSTTTSTSTTRREDADPDQDDWAMAAAVASVANKEVKTTEAADTTTTTSSTNKPPPLAIPQVARMHHMDGTTLRDRDGHRMIHVTPGRMDDSVISLKTYALAIALYIDRKLAADSTERITLLVDVRGGVGWRNLNGVQLLSFTQHTLGLLLAMFPDRLAKSIVYPLPSSFEWVWNIVKRCIDPDTAKDICVLSGPAFIVSPPPAEQMAEYMEETIVEHLERERKAAFIYPATSTSTTSSTTTTSPTDQEDDDDNKEGDE